MNPPPALLRLLQNQLIPWSQEGAEGRLVVAHREMKTAQLPETVQLEQRRLRGKRRIVKGERLYGNTRMCRAEWPEDGLIEIESPKLICVLGGQADFPVGEYLLSCSAGHFIFIPPRAPHADGKYPHLEGERRENGSCDLLQVLAFQHGIHCWICHSRGARHFSIASENYLIRSERAAQLFHLMMEEAVAGRENAEPIYRHLLATFLLLLQREVNAGHYTHPGASTASENPIVSSSDFLTRLNAYLLGHLHESLTLESVAREMHLSRAQFARRIRRQTGKTLIEYLTEYRLQEARTLLTESEWTASAIAEFVGFKSAAYFHRLFRREMGVTPVEYRQRSRRAAARPKKIRPGSR